MAHLAPGSRSRIRSPRPPQERGREVLVSTLLLINLQTICRHYLQIKRPHRSRQQLRPQPPPQPGPQGFHTGPPQPGAGPTPQPGPQPGPRPGLQRSRPQRSRQQRRAHCTSVILSISAVAAAGSGRIGAAWVVPEPPVKTRVAIPKATSTRNICVPPIFPNCSDRHQGPRTTGTGSLEFQ